MPSTPTTTTLTRPRGWLDRPLALLRDNPTLIPALGGVAVIVALGGSEAGFYPIDTAQHRGLGWYPAAVLLLALLTAAAIAVPASSPLPRSVAAAIALFAGYTAWSYLSILWAEDQGGAWDGANRTALYLVVFTLFAGWPLTVRAGTLLLGALGAGIAGLGVVELLTANASADPMLYFIGARFAEPAGYINANVALWTIGLWPCLYLACTRRMNPLLRGLALGGAGVLACLALMGQSRGWVLAVPLAALVFIALMPSRARAVAAVGVVAVGTALTSGPLLAVHDDFSEARFDALLGDATAAILVLGAALSAIGFVAALVDRRVRLSAGRSRNVNRGAVAAVVLVLLVGGGVTAARTGDPIAKLSESWQSFKAGGQAGGAGGARLASVDTNRYDFWSVAWSLFREQPVLGIGAENFQQDYLVRGASTEQPRYPHSFELGVLSQTGVVGAILLGAALLAAGFAALTVRRRGSPAAASAAGAAGAVFAYWLLHASVDWFWEFPALTAAAFAALGLAGSVGRGKLVGDHERVPTPVQAPGLRWLGRLRRRALPRPLGAVLASVTGGLLALSLVAPWLAERHTELAASGWRDSPDAAYERLERAQTLNPLSPKPHLVAASIAVMMEDQERTTRELQEVLRLQPRTAFALAELGALASQSGRPAESERLLRRGLSYAPRDDVLMEALRRVRSGDPIDVNGLNASYLDKMRSRIGRSDPSDD